MQPENNACLCEIETFHNNIIADKKNDRIGL